MLDISHGFGHDPLQVSKVVQQFPSALHESIGGPGTLRLASRLPGETPSTQLARPPRDAPAGNEALRPPLLPVDAWIDLARTSHYDAIELRPHLGLSAEQSESLGDTLFGWPAQEWLDFIRVSDAAALVRQGFTQPKIELSLSVRDGPGFWIWGSDFVDFVGCHAGQVIRINRRACADSPRGPWPVCGLVLPEGAEMPGPWIAGLPGLSAICHWPGKRGAEEATPAKRCLFAGECLHLRISFGVERARDALGRMLLGGEALRARLQDRWPYADRQLVAEAIETAMLDYVDHPSRFDPGLGKTLPNFLLLIAQRRMADSERTEQRRRRMLQCRLLAGDPLEPFLDPFAASPSPAEIIMAAGDDAKAERVLARRKQLLAEFAQRRSPTDGRVLKLIRQGQHRHAAYATALSIAGKVTPAQREIVNRERHRIRQALERWMLDRSQRFRAGGQG